MTATYTWDVFMTLDGYGSYEMGPGETEWGGYWSQQGPDLLAARAAQYAGPQRMVYGATTFREVAGIAAEGVDPNLLDEWNVHLMRTPVTVVSSTLTDTLGWSDATIVSGDAAEVVRELKATSPVPLRSQASLSLNRSLVEAGLVDLIQVTVFPAISGRTGVSPVFAGLGDFELELLQSRTHDGRSLELHYRPSRRSA